MKVISMFHISMKVHSTNIQDDFDIFLIWKSVFLYYYKYDYLSLIVNCDLALRTTEYTHTFTKRRYVCVPNIYLFITTHVYRCTIHFNFEFILFSILYLWFPQIIFGTHYLFILEHTCCIRWNAAWRTKLQWFLKLNLFAIICPSVILP